MTTTDTLIARLRQCEAIRDLAEARAKKLHSRMKVVAGCGYVEPQLDLILAPSDPYAMAGLRAVCERADGRWEGWRSTESPGPDAYWSRLEHGPVEALLAEAVEVLCG